VINGAVAGNITVATGTQVVILDEKEEMVLIDPITKKIYLASAKFEPVKPSKDGQGSPWPKVVPGTLKMLVYAPKS
jgi:hypothetical protein